MPLAALTTAVPYVAPLWPPERLSKGGHLPLKGGDQQFRRLVPFFDEGGICQRPRVISPLEGEMAGRPEGGNVEHKGRWLH